MQQLQHPQQESKEASKRLQQLLSSIGGISYSREIRIAIALLTTDYKGNNE
jgi:hypothetical protein